MELHFIQVTIEGVTPVMMHNDRLANPMNEYTRRLKEVTSKRNKTDADHKLMSKLEFLGGIYYDRGIGVHFPSRNMRKSIVDGAKKIKQGTTVQSSVIIREDLIPLQYEGPKEPEALFDAGFADVRTVGNQKARVVRTRPIFGPPWSLSFTLGYFPEQINAGVLRHCLDIAGSLCGIGDYRPSVSGGNHGKYTIATWEVL